MQTAHDQGYLVKHLLNNLPDVTARVKAMLQGRGGMNMEDNRNRMIESQEAYIQVGGSCCGHWGLDNRDPPFSQRFHTEAATCSYPRASIALPSLSRRSTAREA